MALNDSDTIQLSVQVDPVAPAGSVRVREICWQFGIQPKAAAIRLVENVSLSLQPGQITLLTGPSGSGKSATLRELAIQLGQRAIRVDQQRFDPSRPIIDQVVRQGSLAEVISILTACGLGEPRLWLRRAGDLSAGERFRAQAGRAVGLAQRQDSSVLLVDEFCAILHRRLAMAMAYNLRKMVTAGRLCIVVATTHDDLPADLQPDQVLRLGDETPQLQASSPVARPISFFRRLHISTGALRDYRPFEAMHYRQRTGLGPFDKIFVLRDGVGGQALGVVVYGYSPLTLHLRNVATGKSYPRNARLLNRDFRILRRLVMHPDVRGCGLGHWLVRQTLPRVGTRYVECLAAMGAVNPVFERAGMIRFGMVGLPRRQQQLHEELTAMGVDPLAADFGRMVARRQDVREVVGRRVHRWLRSTTGRPIERIRSLTPEALASAFVQLMGSAPIYYLWSTDELEQQRLQQAAARSAI